MTAGSRKYWHRFTVIITYTSRQRFELYTLHVYGSTQAGILVFVTT